MGEEVVMGGERLIAWDECGRVEVGVWDERTEEEEVFGGTNVNI